MDSETLITDVVFYGGLVLVSLWYVKNRRHPGKPLWLAWLQFAGILVGTTLAALIVTVSAIYVLGLEKGGVTKVAAPLIVLGVLVPAWQYANKIIRRAPPTSGQTP